MTLGSWALLLLAVAPQQVPSAPDTTNGWNTTRALRLVERTRARRAQPSRDTALRSYSAKASGHVYFYLDRQGSTEQTLVKVDQIALELHWAAPNLTKQRIVGLRDVDRLPNRMHYHLDHLTVVQNGFGDVIRVGDGDEVRDVPHPAAPGSDSVYDFRLADSISLNFPPQPAVRVYQVQVRPKRADRSGMVGSIYVDQATADIVRMTFTFTPASYVDRRLDYINISLDNGLWNGSYWLPNEQYVEIRRQVPELDFAAGAIIKGRLRVYGYEFNQRFPTNFFFGRPVEAVSEEEREAFAFEEDIYAGLEREDLAAPAQVEQLRGEAVRLLGKRKLSGLPPLRLHLPNASSVYRRNDTEGTFLGGGATYVFDDVTRLKVVGGYAFKVERPSLQVELRTDHGGREFWIGGRYRDARDAMWRPALPVGVNTLSVILLGDDYRRTYFVNAIEAGLKGELGRGAIWQVLAARERHRVDPVDQRRTLPANDDDLYITQAQLDWPLYQGARVTSRIQPQIELGLGNYARFQLAAENAYTSADRRSFGHTRLSAGYLARAEKAPAQKSFILGGVGTLPGHAFGGLSGSRFALVELEANRKLWSPWLTARLVGAAGWVNSDFGAATLPAPTYTQAVSVGAGVGLFWDVIRLDLIKGAGKPRLYFSVKPDFRDLL